MCYDVIAIVSWSDQIGSDRIESRIGRYRSSPLLSSTYLPPYPWYSLLRRTPSRAAGVRKRELFTLYSDVSPTINDRSIDESIKRERMNEWVLVYVWKCVRLAAHYYSGAFAGATIIQGDRRVPRGKYVAAVWWCWWFCRCICVESAL